MKLLLTTIAAVLVAGCGPPKPPDISIHEAARTGNIEAVKQHLAAGTDVDAKNDDGMTPLFAAANNTIGGHKEIVELLLTNGADVNAKDKDGDTPLSYAALFGHKEVAELLIDNGADVNVKVASGPRQGGTPLDDAIKWKDTEIVDLLRKHGGKTGEELKAEEK